MAEIHTTIMKIAISRGNESPNHGETVIYAEIEDDGGGPFITLSDALQREGSGVSICADEWPHVVAAVERLLVECTAIELREAKESSDA